MQRPHRDLLRATLVVAEATEVWPTWGTHSARAHSARNLMWFAHKANEEAEEEEARAVVWLARDGKTYTLAMRPSDKEVNEAGRGVPVVKGSRSLVPSESNARCVEARVPPALRVKKPLVLADHSLHGGGGTLASFCYNPP